MKVSLRDINKVNLFILHLSDKSFCCALQWEKSACVGRIPVMFVCSAVIFYLG